MGSIKILKRAWNIVWNYRVLWIFGFVLALGAAGSSGGSGNSGSRFNINEREQYNQQMPGNMREAFNQAGEAFEGLFSEGLPALGIPQGEMKTLLVIAIVFVLVMIIFGVLTGIARYVSETSIIRMVDEYETSGTQLSFRDGWRLGWNRTAWRLFLINLLVNLPVILLLAFFAVVGYMVYGMVSAPGADEGIWAGMVGIIAVVLSVLFVFAILMAFLNLLRRFFWRFCALEDLGVRASLRAGWQLFRENWKDTGIMWLVMLGLGIAWALVMIIAVLISLPLVAITLLAGVVVAAIPGLLLFGFFSIFLSGYLPWVAAGIFVLPLLLGIGFAPWTLLNGWALTYTSTVWTLVYRELKALPEFAPTAETEIVQLEE